MNDREPVASKLPVIDVAGTHVQIGAAIGESLRDGLQRVAAGHCESLERSIGLERALALARQLEQPSRAALPACIEELEGMAAGSGVEFLTLFSMNALQEIRFLAGRDGANPDADDDDEDGCTSLALSSEATLHGNVLLAHNEDAGTVRGELPYIVRARPTGRPAFVGFAYSGLLLYQGCNAAGIGSVGNALYTRDIRVGTPKLLAYRDVLDAEFLEDALRRATRPWRANGNNHLIANAEGDIYDLEVSGGDFAILTPNNGTLAHANHIVDARLRQLEWGDLLNSRLRQQRAERLLSSQHGRATVESIWAILTDHSNAPKSICKHMHPEHNPHVQTVAGVVIDLTAGEIQVRPGNPCQGETTTVRLSA